MIMWWPDNVMEITLNWDRFQKWNLMTLEGKLYVLSLKAEKYLVTSISNTHKALFEKISTIDRIFRSIESHYLVAQRSPSTSRRHKSSMTNKLPKLVIMWQLTFQIFIFNNLSTELILNYYNILLLVDFTLKWIYEIGRFASGFVLDLKTFSRKWVFHLHMRHMWVFHD